MTFLAFLPQHTQVSPKVSPSWSKGMLREVALNCSLILSSHSRSPHHMALAKPSCTASPSSSIVRTVRVRSSRKARACSSRLCWMSSSRAVRASAMPSRGRVVFSHRSRRKAVTTRFSRSRGPISRRTGTPLSSQSLNLKPADTVSRSSSFTRKPASFSSWVSFSQASVTPGLWAAMGSTTTWMGARRGGRRRPRSSPWVMMMAPIRRVDTPQLVSWT